MEEGREKRREAGKTERETSFTLFTTIIMHIHKQWAKETIKTATHKA